MEKQRIGILGTGKINTAMTEGLFRAGIANLEVVVSPRNRGRAERLAARYTGVRVAADNQDVLESSDVVFAALLPEAAEEIITGMRFKRHHTVFCLVPTLTLSHLRKILAPAERIFRAVPLLSVSHHIGPIVYFPEDPEASNLLGMLGQPLAAPDEWQLHLLWALTGLISPYYSLLAQLSGWLIARGVDPDLGAGYATGLFQALSALPLESGEDLNALSEEAATPGGMNAMALRMIEESGAFETFRSALDAVIARYPEIV
ncbi:NAD(P)-binding domain-containing protein [Acidobacteriota bacterium]